MTTTPLKTALVTGGNRGIGRAIAQGLLAQNYQVIITATSLDRAQEAASQLSEAGDVILIELNVGNDDSITKAMKMLQQQVDRLDVLVNNAGIYPDEGVNILTIDRSLLNTTLNINTLGPIQVVQACLPLLEKAENARVINVSSSYGEISGLSAEVPSYCLSKLALNGATIMLAQALSSKGIAVNSICPGWVRTDMGGASAPRSPEQGADTAVWLATEAPHSETGKFWRDREAIAF